ncbi:unnamed protein product [Dovyalis caffra]|uniref:Uncharacterized protein n=1 Tax=Dovyalis caffra TaxID=77055 RepID=A0AAV1SI28_9ROSI|nr:unnamed protein product [Dovyalis caffra]
MDALMEKNEDLMRYLYRVFDRRKGVELKGKSMLSHILAERKRHVLAYYIICTTSSIKETTCFLSAISICIPSD